jgi:hypothetical protein
MIVAGAMCVPMVLVAAGAGRQATAGASMGPVAPLASPAPDGSAQPNLTSDAQGRVHLSWLETRLERGHRFRVSSFDGARWADAVTIAEGTNLLANWADFPSVFVAADGTMAAHWLERGSGREAYFVRLKTSRDGGRTWGDTLTPHRDESQTEHGFVSFYDAPGGGFGLAWLDGREMAAGGGHAGGNMTLRSTVLRNGVLGDEQVVDARVCECCQTSAARTTDAVLVAYRDRSDKEVRDMSVARFAGGAWSAPVTVHADQWEIHGCPVNGPAIAASGNTAAVGWFTGAGGTPRTFAAFSADGGRSFGRPIRIGRDDSTTLGRLGMLVWSVDRALVSSLERAETGARILIRDVRRDGRVSDPIAIATTTPDRTGGFARLARLGSRVIVAWTEIRQGSAPVVRTATVEIR